MLNYYLDRMLGITFQAEDYLVDTAPSSIAAPNSVAALAASRAEQAMTITAYQLYIHREVFEPILRNGTAEQIAIARNLKVECIVLAEEFRAFARLWHIDAVLEQWHVYQPAALLLRDRIRAHINNVKKGALALNLQTRRMPAATSRF